MITRLRQVSFRHVAIDAMVILSSGFFSYFALRSSGQISLDFTKFSAWLVLATSMRLLVFAVMGVYEAIWRYVSLSDAIKLGKAIVASTIVLYPVAAFGSHELPFIFFVLNFSVLTTLLGSARVARRKLYEKLDQKAIRRDGRRTLIFGAGSNGLTLAKRFSTDGFLKTNLLGFVDDDKIKLGHSIAGVKVIGSRKDLADLFKRLEIEELVISVGRMPGNVLNEVLQMARAQGVRVKMLSDFGLNDDNVSRFELFRNVELDDLLNRPKAQIDLASVKKLIQGKRVMITGAGGTIGSELARQVANFDPERLCILDSSEYNLYQIDRELRPSNGDISKVVPLLIDLKDKDSLSDAVREYRPEIIFHAAAYKHVHLVQLNPFSAILNNIEGLRNLLNLSEEVNTGTFLLISTDKAVNAVGVMGATKRLCELMVANRARKTGKIYCAVRFGNVVGSSGSLIPLLKNQIRDGGPVTITHEAMTRYFMLVREAVALVLKAASISSPGSISILKMGEPIRILDIAKNLITLLGKTEDQVPIVFTGMRPGERLHEELYMSGDEVSTEHSDILFLPQGSKSYGLHKDGDLLEASVSELLATAKGGKGDAVGILMALIAPEGSKQSAASNATGELTRPAASSAKQQEGLSKAVQA